MRKRVLPPEDTLSANSSAAAAVKCFTPRSTPRNTVTATGAAIRPTIGGSGNTAKCSVRIWSASAAAKNSRPNVQVPAIAATPVGKKTIENVLQISCLVVDSTLFSSYCKSIHFELYNKHIATLIIGFLVRFLISCSDPPFLKYACSAINIIFLFFCDASITPDVVVQCHQHYHSPFLLLIVFDSHILAKEKGGSVWSLPLLFVRRFRISLIKGNT